MHNHSCCGTVAVANFAGILSGYYTWYKYMKQLCKMLCACCFYNILRCVFCFLLCNSISELKLVCLSVFYCLYLSVCLFVSVVCLICLCVCLCVGLRCAAGSARDWLYVWQRKYVLYVHTTYAVFFANTVLCLFLSACRKLMCWFVLFLSLLSFLLSVC